MMVFKILKFLVFLVALTSQLALANGPIPKNDSWGNIIGYTLTLQGLTLAGMAAFGEDEDEIDHDNFERAFSEGPVTDDDDFHWNYIFHPIAGSEYYIRAREAGADEFQSFLYSAAASAFWEYGVESWIRQPSKQDLVITPVLGSFLGELRYYVKYNIEDSSWYADPLHTLLFGKVHLDARVNDGGVDPMLAFDHRF